MALNTAIIFLKSEKRRSFIKNDEIENLMMAVDHHDDVEEQKFSKMYSAIQQLNKIDKALIFYYLEDYSGKEIAANMGITEVNARVKLGRAKDKLKQLIQN